MDQHATCSMHAMVSQHEIVVVTQSCMPFVRVDIAVIKAWLHQAPARMTATTRRRMLSIRAAKRRRIKRKSGRKPATRRSRTTKRVAKSHIAKSGKSRRGSTKTSARSTQRGHEGTNGPQAVPRSPLSRVGDFQEQRH